LILHRGVRLVHLKGEWQINLLSIIDNKLYLYVSGYFRTLLCMAQSLLPAHLRPGYDPFTIRNTGNLLLSLGLIELGIWLFSCLNEFYAGTGSLVLSVQPSLAFAQAHSPLSQTITSAAGTYFTGTKGELLYHATSLSDYFWFYTIGDLTSLDALFFAGLGIYLHWALRRLPAGREFTPAICRAVEVVGLTTVVMFVLKMLMAIAASQLFWAKTDHLFRLAGNKSQGCTLYMVFGFLLLLCAAFFRRGQQLQQENELTI
jgi:hypothetical protein